MDRPLHSLEPKPSVRARHRVECEARAADNGSGPSLSILGIRGLPAHHGGFETFAGRLAPFLVQQGWRVTVYCQEEEPPLAVETVWQGVRLIHLSVGADTPLNSIKFDHACIGHAIRERASLVLTLGYNTALLSLRLRRAGIVNVMNMDGLEWARAKWSLPARAWLYLNDWAGCLGADHLIADHPEIARHLETRVRSGKITTIPYGTDLLDDADPALLAPLGVEPGAYASVIARPEPENSILEIVQAFSAKPRGVKLLVLGNLQPRRSAYHAKVQRAASDEVVFAGAIFDTAIVGAVRLYSIVYLHGHRVGGTNPSLIEAMGAGNPVLAHNNRFNRWVAAGGALYFDDVASCRKQLDTLLNDRATRRRLSESGVHRAVRAFSWERVLRRYELTLSALHAAAIRGMPGSPPPASSYDPSNFMDPGP